MNRNLLIGLLIGSQTLGMSVAAIASDAVSASEKKHICDIAQDGMAEVKLGKLAESKASKAEVKEFGKKMVIDHTLANNKLKEAAASSKVTLPNDVNDVQKATFDALSKLSGKAFDEKYMAEMVKGHDKAVTAIGDEASNGTGVLKDWAEKTIATIKSHDQLSKKVNTDVDKR